jgi:hypothetical protein
MTDAKVEQELENMALLDINGSQMALPIEQAVAVMVLLKKARKYEYRYTNDGEQIHHIGGAMHRVKVELMSGEMYTEGLINGERKRT